MIDLGIGNLRIKKAGRSGIYALFNGEDLVTPLTSLEEHLASMVEELEQRLAAAEAKLPRWIPVGERLPEHNQLIAMLTEHEKLCGEFYLDRFVVRDFTGVCFDASCVTHWMPLPEPPESGRGE